MADRRDHKPDPLFIVLCVYDLDTDEMIRKHDFDYMDIEAKRHINKINLWALNNGKTVEIMHKEDWQEENEDAG